MIGLEAAKLDELRSRLTGTVILPGDDAYDSARTIWNAAIDKRPGAIARCSTTSDVVQGGDDNRKKPTVLCDSYPRPNFPLTLLARRDADPPCAGVGSRITMGSRSLSTSLSAVIQSSSSRPGTRPLRR